VTDTGLRRFALIGFGEAGAILGQDLVAAGREVVMYDILLDSPRAPAPATELPSAEK
jgi:3-hydroxyisobutyrate dehydrogenase-like beta-hydroxyacid dehydrogenase